MECTPEEEAQRFASITDSGRPLQRWRVTPQVNAVLEAAFALASYPNRDQRHHLARTLHATERNIQVWFQNRRQREKKGLGQAGAVNPFATKMVTKRPLLDSHGKIEQGVVEPNKANVSPPKKRPEYEQRRAVSYDTAFCAIRSASHLNLFMEEAGLGSACSRGAAASGASGEAHPLRSYASARSVSVVFGGHT